MKTICLVGAGNIGSRHLQGLKKANIPLSINVIDPSRDSLNLALKRYRKVKENSNKHKITFNQDYKNLPEKIDLAIVATSSNVRRKVVEKLLNSSKVQYMILEKLLFQKKQDYFFVEKLLKKNNCKTFVNCCMRSMSFYSSLKKKINGPVNYFVSGSQYGLITNAIHYIDHLAYLAGSTDFEVDTTLLDPKLIASKREGFIELNGTLNVYFKNGSFGSFTCYADGNAPIVIQISSKNYRCISKESEQKSWESSKKDSWVWKEIPVDILFQSEMTNKVTSDLLKSKKCPLTPFSESVKIHLNLLEGLLRFLNQKKVNYNFYPFT